MKKRIRKKRMKREAKELARKTLEEANVFTEAANPIVDLERGWKQQADDVKEEARILAEAQNDMDNALEEKPVHHEKRFDELFDEVNAVVEAQNEMDDGTDEANRHHLKHLEEAKDPREWNPETVIDEKIKEEQKEGEEQALRDEIVRAFE